MKMPVIEHSEIESWEFESVWFSYEDGAPIFQKTDCVFPLDGVACVKAPAGSGKSTLLRVLGGLETVQRGAYKVNGHDFQSLSTKTRDAFRLSVGFGFARGGLLSNYTLLDNLMLPLDYHEVGSPSQRLSRARSALEAFGIAEEAASLPAFVSSSARKACGLARALLLDPRILLLDDPTADLDAKTAKALSQRLQIHLKDRGLQQVLLASDDAGFLEGFSPQVLEIRDRGLVTRKRRA